RAELRRLHDRLGTTMIYVTHDQTEAMTLADRVAVLDRGVVQQIGPPQALYDQPDNLFVAQFLGHPAINKIDGEVCAGRLRAGAIELSLPAVEGGETLPDGMRVTMGIRPEHVIVMSGNRSDAVSHQAGPRISGMVRLLEYTGSQTWGIVEVDQSGKTMMIIGAVQAGESLRPGQPASVFLAGGPHHLFAGDTGMRLGIPHP
ncbi:MAG: TOBE domain-containing protein, partial [Nitrospira sp.]|nr:TOBE domain-containing protein [Nitrospira sp.]